MATKSVSTKKLKMLYSVLNHHCDVIAKFCLVSDAIVAADAMHEAFGQGFYVSESRTGIFIHRTNK